MTKKEKVRIIKKIVWDYKIQPEKLLKKLSGPESDEKIRQWFFVRTFESLPWQKVVGFWGVDTCLKMDEKQIRSKIRPQLRGKYDRIYKLLRREPVSPAEWDLESYRQIIKPFLSDRWNRFEQSVSST